MKVRVLFLTILISGIVGISCSDSDQMLETSRLGLHCLNEDGHSDSFSRAIRERLIDPNSFEAVSTNVEPVIRGNADGTPIELNAEELAATPKSELKYLGHFIQMDYKGTNKFDVVLRKTALGHLDHQTCEAQFFGVE